MEEKGEKEIDKEEWGESNCERGGESSGGGDRDREEVVVEKRFLRWWKMR